MSVFHEFKDIIREFYPEEEASVDYLVNTFGGVTRALAKVREMGQPRLFRIIAKYYPDEAIDYITSIDDIELLYSTGLLSVIDIGRIFAVADENNASAIWETLADIEVEVNNSIRDHNLEEFIQLTQGMLINSFMSSIYSHDAVEIFRYVHDTYNIGINIPLIISSEAFQIFAYVMNNLLSEEEIDDAMLDLMRLNDPSLYHIAINYARRGRHERQRAIQLAIEFGAIPVLEELGFSDDDKIDDIHIERPAFTMDTITYLVSRNNSLRRSIAEIALFYGMLDIVEMMGEDPMELIQQVPSIFIRNAIMDSMDYDDPSTIIAFHCLDRELVDLKKWRNIAQRYGANRVIKAIKRLTKSK